MTLKVHVSMQKQILSNIHYQILNLKRKAEIEVYIKQAGKFYSNNDPANNILHQTAIAEFVECAELVLIFMQQIKIPICDKM